MRAVRKEFKYKLDGKVHEVEGNVLEVEDLPIILAAFRVNKSKMGWLVCDYATGTMLTGLCPTQYKALNTAQEVIAEQGVEETKKILSKWAVLNPDGAELFETFDE